MNRTAMLRPAHAMVLAAGMGARMRPVTNGMPKPLVRVAGKPLIDHVLDKLVAASVDIAVVNVHYFADQIEQHLHSRRVPKIIISDERPRLLDTGGGVRKALPSLGTAPFFLVNSDTLWIDGVASNLERLAHAFDVQNIDALLMLAPTSSIGYAGRGDFSMGRNGVLHRRGERDAAPFVYAGMALLSPKLFGGAPESEPFSLNVLFDRAMAAERLRGLHIEGVWMHVGSPEAVAAAEAAIHAGAA